MPAIVQQVTGSAASATGFTTSAVTTTAGNALLFVVGRSGGLSTGALTAVTDPVGNTWTMVTRGSISGGSNTRVELWSTTQNVGPLNGQAISCTSGTAQTNDYSVIEVSGVDLTSLVEAASPDGSGTTSATPATPAVTTTTTNDLVLSIIHHAYNAVADTVSTAGWTLLTPAVYSTVHTTSLAYQVEAAAGTYGPTWSRGGAVNGAEGTITVALKGAAAATPAAILSIGAASSKNHFDLQMARSGDAAYTTQTQTQIEAGYSESPYFTPVRSGTAVQFSVPLDAPLVGSASGPRSELREVDASDVSAAYDINVGTHEFHGFSRIMTSDSDVVCAQLHNGASDRISLRTQLVSGTIRLRWRVNGSSIAPDLASPYVLGTEFEWKIRVINGAIFLFYNDMVTPVYTAAAGTFAATAGVTTWYFKAGAYAQAVGTSAQSATTELRGLTVSHAAAAPAATPTLTAGTPANSTASVTSQLVPLTGLTFAAGDYVMLFATLNASSGVITAPAGYSTVLASTDTLNGSTSGHGAIFYKKWSSGDGDPTVTCTSGRIGVLPVKATGYDGTTLVDTAPVVTQAASGATAVDAPSITPTATQLITMFVGRNNSNGSPPIWTPPSGMTEVGEAGGNASAATNTSLEVAYLNGITSGAATGTRTATASLATTGAFGVSFALKAASASGSTVSAGLSGSGTLTAATTSTVTAPAGLSGSGVLAATVVTALTQTASLSGAGTLAATAQVSASRAAALSGSGTLTAMASQAVTVALSGSGTLTASASGQGTATANLTGAGALTATTTVTATRTAALTGTGTLTATSSGALNQTAALSGTGVLTATTAAALMVTANLTAAGQLTAVSVGTVPDVTTHVYVTATLVNNGGSALLVGDSTGGLATLVPIAVAPGGFGTGPFGLLFGVSAAQPNAAGAVTVTAVTGLATLQTT